LNHVARTGQTLIIWSFRPSPLSPKAQQKGFRSRAVEDWFALYAWKDALEEHFHWLTLGHRWPSDYKSAYTRNCDGEIQKFLSSKASTFRRSAAVKKRKRKEKQSPALQLGEQQRTRINKFPSAVARGDDGRRSEPERARLSPRRVLCKVRRPLRRGILPRARQRRLRWMKEKFVVQCQAISYINCGVEQAVRLAQTRIVGQSPPGTSAAARSLWQILQLAKNCWSMRVSHELCLHVTGGEYGERSAGLYFSSGKSSFTSLAFVQLISKIAVSS
jgi:hypothetical protein